MVEGRGQGVGGKRNPDEDVGLDTVPCPKCGVSRMFWEKRGEKWICFGMTCNYENNPHNKIPSQFHITSKDVHL